MFHGHQTSNSRVAKFYQNRLEIALVRTKASNGLADRWRNRNGATLRAPWSGDQLSLLLSALSIIARPSRCDKESPVANLTYTKDCMKSTFSCRSAELRYMIHKRRKRMKSFKSAPFIPVSINFRTLSRLSNGIYRTSPTTRHLVNERCIWTDQSGVSMVDAPTSSFYLILAPQKIVRTCESSSLDKL